MTQVRYQRKDGEFYLECKGHAGYASMGNDIVCAAISTLSQTLIAYLLEQNISCDYQASSADLWVMAKGVAACIAFDVTLCGLKMLADNYPDHVKIEKGVPYISAHASEIIA